MLIHWIWLATRPSVSERTQVMLLQHFRDPEDIYFADDTSFAHIEGLSRDAAESLQDKNLDRANQILRDCEKHKIHILTYQDVAYPTRLKHIPDPPLVLYYKGTLPDFDGSPVIGVVGTRKTSGYGLVMATRMGYQIGKCGGIVVSGLAKGADANAMKGALTASAPVVGVLGCGADMIYPLSNKALYADTENYGCILTEFPPGTEPFGWNFPKRNRIISGLSCGVLVIEAPEGSGALITANRALDQGRDVFVLPGNVDSPTYEGNFRLLREGATPVNSGWMILSEYEALFPGKIRMDTSDTRQQIPETREPEIAKVAQEPQKPRKKQKPGKKSIDNAFNPAYSDVNKALPDLSPAQRVLVDILRSGEQLVDDVIAQSKLPAHQVSSEITMLTIKGVVKKLPGNRIVLK